MNPKSIRVHLPILALLQAVVFLSFGRILSSPLWRAADFEILYDANILSRDLGVMFRHVGTLVSQPLLQLWFLAEYRLFGLDMTGYYAVNLALHGLNAFLLYMLVNMLFANARLAILAALLFALTVGSYGKVLLSLASLELLLLTFLYLLILYSLIRNDFRHEGRIRSPWFALALGLFTIAGLTKPTMFSLLGCLLAYKLFFFGHRGGRPVLSADILILIAAGVAFYAAQRAWGVHTPIAFSEGGAIHFTWISFKNIFRYLTLMLFPLQESELLRRWADPFIQYIYDGRTVIRFLLTLAIVSFSFFGIVFGSKAIRFFIAWTFITVLPFTGVTSRGQWLNLQYLYLVSLGFCVILAAAAVGASKLLAAHRWRRWIPYALPLLFAIASVTLTLLLDQQNRATSRNPDRLQLRAWLEESIAAPHPPARPRH